MADGRSHRVYGATPRSVYSQLFKWGLVLTRGNVGKVEETIQEFCLYFVLTKPDLNNVTNLDGYLYTYLRHIYISALARSSREAMSERWAILYI